MGHKFAKKFGRLELADFLADLSEQLRRGKLEGKGQIWTVPEEIDVDIHLKEEDGYVSGKISWHWSAPDAHRRESPGAPTSFKEVKGRLGTGFKELQRLIREGVFPDDRLMQDYMENSRTFAQFAKPEWQGPLADYLAHLEKLQAAVEQRQLEAMHNELQALVNCMSACHREFKK